MSLASRYILAKIEIWVSEDHFWRATCFCSRRKVWVYLSVSCENPWESPCPDFSNRRWISRRRLNLWSRSWRKVLLWGWYCRANLKSVLVACKTQQYLQVSRNFYPRAKTPQCWCVGFLNDLKFCWGLIQWFGVVVFLNFCNRDCCCHLIGWAFSISIIFKLKNIPIKGWDGLINYIYQIKQAGGVS
jgi:hypothetical protein